MLGETVKKFIANLLSENHIAPLLQSCLTITLETKEEVCHIIFENGNAIKAVDIENPMLLIKGSVDLLYPMFMNDAPLIPYIKDKGIEVNGSYKYLLQFESILHCSSFKER